jgi:hypothetical protein
VEVTIHAIALLSQNTASEILVLKLGHAVNEASDLTRLVLCLELHLQRRVEACRVVGLCVSGICPQSNILYLVP